MRRIARTDDNQQLIVKQLRQLGCSVAITSMIGKGFPDLVVAYQGKNFLIELKDGSKPKSQKGLTMDEAKFFTAWKGQIDKCESLDEICKVIGIILF
jgi:thymidine kinase